MQTRTPQEIRQAFKEHGVTIAEWARARGFSEELVYSVLLGRVLGVRGEGHRIAVALGLKATAQDVSPLLWPTEGQNSTPDKEIPMADG